MRALGLRGGATHWDSPTESFDATAYEVAYL
jgi:hypothetical protein